MFVPYTQVRFYYLDGFINSNCFHKYPFLQSQHEAGEEVTLTTVVHHRGDVGKVKNDESKQCKNN